MTREQLNEIIAKAPELLREKLGELHEAGKPKVRIGCSIIIELNHRTPTLLPP